MLCYITLYGVIVLPSLFGVSFFGPLGVRAGCSFGPVFFRLRDLGIHTNNSDYSDDDDDS